MATASLVSNHRLYRREHLEGCQSCQCSNSFFLNTPSPPTPSPPSDDGTNRFLTVLFFLSLTSRDPPPQPGHPSLSPQTP